LKAAHLDPRKRTITYCVNGVHSAASYIALRAAGFSDLAVYDGSWAEGGLDMLQITQPSSVVPPLYDDVAGALRRR
jgi:3-mercaptopyruvate sulfurtransferase SseA